MTEGQNEFKKPRRPKPVSTPTEPSKGEKTLKRPFHGYDWNPRIPQFV